MTKLRGKIAVITGGNSGMGLATAQLFAKEGAKVIITGRRQKELDEAVESIGADAEGVLGDVSKLSDLDSLHDHVKAKYGRVDVIFANAGLGSLTPVDQVTEAQFDETFNVNVKGTYFTVQKLLPLVPDGGSIILNASIASSTGMEAFSVYSATKAAVRSLARTLTADLKARKIRVNAISPGPIDTPIFGKTGLTDEQIEGFKAGIASQVPLGRIGLSEEIAKPALFLASDDSSYISGIELTVDGGMAQV
ncbi:short-chain dehydrogenase/reductase SDR [Caballeronia fortuita]|uniref:Short-chain dehydrogenase/reductase SDR n=1 Tax=Caballeronia fortuita TaxID=1777138 RepID=A0A158AHA3_9BURK|nr:glucose 1-dehydrogenase [Caballeronia fortuita]SAK57140.1 short-chain dehydrogenase/reductase SDR [Caballeronia fortuita]